MTRPPPTTQPQLRLFVAFELLPSWLEALQAAQDGLRGALSPNLRLRWSRPEGIHLTLKFIGEVPESRRPAFETALVSVVTSAPALTLSLGSLGSFGDRRAPRVVWVAVEGQVAELAALAARLDTALAACGVARERRPLSPHLTLARVPEGFAANERPAFDRALSQAPQPEASAHRFDEVSLMLSHLGAGGARYGRLAAFPRH